MDLVEIYKIRAEAPQAVLAALDDVLAGEAHVVRALAHREADLRGQDDVVAHPFYRAARDLLRDPVRVDVGGVDEVAAGTQEIGDEPLGSLLVGLPAERHAAEAQLGDHEPRVPQTPVIHAHLPNRPCPKTEL